MSKTNWRPVGARIECGKPSRSVDAPEMIWNKGAVSERIGAPEMDHDLGACMLSGRRLRGIEIAFVWN